MADRLLAPAREGVLPYPDVGFGDDFVGYEGERISDPGPPAPPVSEAPPAPVQAPVERREPVAVPAATVLPEPAPVVEAVVEEAISPPPLPGLVAGFRDWLHQQFGAREALLLDPDGSAVFDDNRHGRFQGMARNLLKLGERGSKVRVKIGAIECLELLPVETAHGRQVVGAVVAQPLDAAAATAIANALRLVADRRA